MNMSEQEQIRKQGLRGTLRRDEPMARHVSWRAGGRARCTYAPADLDDMALFLRGLPDGEPVCMVGLGSNLLVRDGGYDGTVIFTHWALRDVRVTLMEPMGGEIMAQAGVASPKVARIAALNNLAGAEFLAGIPGTVGGTVAMNAGCYGSETWDIVAQVETIDRAGLLRVRTPGHYTPAITLPLIAASSAAAGSCRTPRAAMHANTAMPRNGSCPRPSVCRAATEPKRGRRSKPCCRNALPLSRWENPMPDRYSAIRRMTMRRA